MSKPIPGRHICLVDPCILSAHTPDRETESELPPGALLPPDFPREGYSADQLIELEEWYLLAGQTALQRFFFLTRTTRDGGEPTARSVMYCCAILAKIFGFNPGMSWARIATQLGTSPSHLCKLRQEVWRRLRGSMQPATAFELQQTAARLRHIARKADIASAQRRKRKNRNS